jgi:hypothetical protein
MFDALAISTTIRAPQNRDDSFDEVSARLGIQGGDFSNHQISAGGEQFAWPRVRSCQSEARQTRSSTTAGGRRVGRRIGCS